MLFDIPVSSRVPVRCTASGAVDKGDLSLWATNFGAGAAPASRTAAIDAIFAAGDFTATSAVTRNYRPPRRGEVARRS